jgi:hypothetical protein
MGELHNTNVPGYEYQVQVEAPQRGFGALGMRCCSSPGCEYQVQVEAPPGGFNALGIDVDGGVCGRVQIVQPFSGRGKLGE